MMRFLTITVAFFVSLTVLPAGLPLHAQTSKPSLKTPQDAFSAARAALQKGDLGALCECLTDDSRDLLGGGLTVGVLNARKIIAAAGKEDDKLLMKKLGEVLAKHGLSETVLRAAEPQAAAFAASDLATRLKTVRALLDPVKDRNAFVAELFATLHKNAPRDNGVGGLGKGRSELTELKIDTDEARGIVVSKQDAKETRKSILFKKVGDSWRIDLTTELNKAFGPKAPTQGP